MRGTRGTWISVGDEICVNFDEVQLLLVYTHMSLLYLYNRETPLELSVRDGKLLREAIDRLFEPATEENPKSNSWVTIIKRSCKDTD